MQTTDAPVTLERALARFAREGELYERLPEGRVRCYACGHRCLIVPGQRGVCKVRWNEDGRLMVPAGYVAGLQLDPVEKKPFFHAYPGAQALSFGMLGCDYHCSFCVAPQTLIATSKGLLPIAQLFEQGSGPAEADHSSIRVMPGLEVYTHTGGARQVRALFRHPYSGTMVRLEPAYLLPLRLTPDHEVLSISEDELESGARPPRFIRADRVTQRHYLAIPRQFEFSRPASFAVAEVLQPVARRIRYRRKFGRGFLQRVLRLSERGLSSREIGRKLGMDASHIRHLRSKVQRGIWDIKNLSTKPARVQVENGRVRLSKEHAPGIPERLPLDAKLAALLGYYAAEGCVVHARKRVHSATVTFSLGHHEGELAERIRTLLVDVFGVTPALVRPPTTLVVAVGKASVALFFERLCGTGAQRKHLPAELFHSPKPVVETFLSAYVEGDGHRRRGGMVSVPTVSRRLAHEVAWLVLKTGRFASIRRTPQARRGLILGRTVSKAPNLFTVYWFDESSRRHWLRQDDRYFYIPIRHVRRTPYHGFVYNLEVEDDHSYLAQFVATHNCQNFLTSQALRDPVAGVPPQEVTPVEIVDLALRHRARILTSTYNEPLITSEWAVEVFREGRARGLTCSYVSNGNATPEVLDYLRPWVDLYKVDLKGFDDRRYRKLGGLLQTVLDTIRLLHAKGFWLEIVTLVIPGFNDGDAELRDLARFLVSVSPDVPWHVTAFHRDYKMTDRPDTTARALLRAAEIGVGEGLRYVYAGNLPGRVGPFENTYCPSCRGLLIERVGYTIVSDRLTPTGGACPACGTAVPGRWA
ncbi:MAG: radical SAM protein [Candidatus Rokubacteria bacterium]|nr:radical SAM protein [Candidatus Rokubacteria bacterium]